MKTLKMWNVCYASDMAIARPVASLPRWRGSRTTHAGLLGGTWGGSPARSFWSRREIVQENAGRLASAQFGSAGVDSRPSARLLANIEPPRKLAETGSRFTDGIIEMRPP